MTTNTLATTRRAMLAAIPAAAAFAAIPTASAGVVNRSQWEAALTTYERAKAEREVFGLRFDAIHDAWKANRPTTDGIHWQKFPFENRDHVARTLNLEERWIAYQQAEGKTWWSKDREATKRDYRAALDSVQAYRDAELLHGRNSGFDAAEEHYDALTDAEIEAQDRMLATPAPDLAALRYKLGFIFADEGSETITPWSQNYIAQTKADISRLLGDA